jgi:3-oxoacyl-[acyl-carrier-protein] synthase-3
MGTVAAERALKKAQLDPRNVDLVICATTTPDHLLPATAPLIQHNLGAVHAGAFDINSACTGSLAALICADQFIRSGTCERVLVVAGETLSRFLNWQDRTTSVLFGDGAAALLVEATEQRCGILSSFLGCRGDVDRLLTIEAGGCALPATEQTIAQKNHSVRMRGSELFKWAVRGMVHAAQQVLGQAHLEPQEIRKVIPHQANVRIITAVQEALAIPSEQMFIDGNRYGNTGAASIPIALADFLETESVTPGDPLLLVAFGGGMTWGGVVVRWANVAEIVSRRQRLSQPPNTNERGTADQNRLGLVRPCATAQRGIV